MLKKIFWMSLILNLSSSYALNVQCEQKVQTICGDKSFEECIKNHGSMFTKNDQKCLDNFAEKKMSESTVKSNRCIKVYRDKCSNFEGGPIECMKKFRNSVPSECQSYFNEIKDPKSSGLVQTLQSTSCFQKLMAKCPITEINTEDIAKFQKEHMSCFNKAMKSLKGECEKELEGLQSSGKL